MLRFLKSFGLLMGLATFASQAEAATISFSGTTGVFVNSLAGLSWNITAELNDSATDLNASIAIGGFGGTNALNSLSFTLDGETVTAGPSGFALITKNFSGSPGLFGFETTDFGSQTLQGLPILGLGLNFTNASSPFSDPNDLGLSLADFVASIGVFTQNVGNGSPLNLSGLSTRLVLEDVTLGSLSPVPVPAALPLFISGLLGLGFITRRRRA